MSVKRAVRPNIAHVQEVWNPEGEKRLPIWSSLTAAFQISCEQINSMPFTSNPRCPSTGGAYLRPRSRMANERRGSPRAHPKSTYGMIEVYKAAGNEGFGLTGPSRTGTGPG